MTRSLRVILEIGKAPRRIVAGAMDWPGLDRWGKSEAAAVDVLRTYVDRYAPVARRAGLEADLADEAPTAEVVERVPGSSSTDFWGVAHVPSQIEHEPLSSDELERRLALLAACWAYFDDTLERRAPTRRTERWPNPRADHPPCLRVRTRAVHAEGGGQDAQGGGPDPRWAHRASAADARCHSRVPPRGAAGPHLAAAVPHSAHRPPRDGPRVGAGGPRYALLRRRPRRRRRETDAVDGMDGGHRLPTRGARANIRADDRATNSLVPVLASPAEGLEPVPIARRSYVGEPGRP